MKKVLLLLFLLAGTAMAQTGFVQYEAILASMPDVEPIRKELTDLSDKLRTELDKAEANSTQKLQDLQYQAQKPGTTDEQKQQFGQQAAALQNEYQNAAKAAELQLGAKENDLMKPILNKLNEAIQAVAKEKGLKLVVNATQVVYSEPGANISIDVAKRLGIQIDAEGKPTGK
jgi:outer membrane protein